jgi:hypothetical protein
MVTKNNQRWSLDLKEDSLVRAGEETAADFL